MLARLAGASASPTSATPARRRSATRAPALVAAARDGGHRVVPLPGPSSALAALAVGRRRGGPGGFAFVGFLPARGAERERRSSRAGARRATQSAVRGAAPDRIAAAALARRARNAVPTLCRELTKQFETIATMAAHALPAWLGADANRSRGEFVLVLHATRRAAGREADAHDARPRRCSRRCR